MLFLLHLPQVCYIDEVHIWAGAGAAEGALNAADILIRIPGPSVCAALVLYARRRNVRTLYLR